MTAATVRKICKDGALEVPDGDAMGYLRERGIKRVYCVGLALDFCVRFSAEDARREGFDAMVIESACRGIDINGSVAAAKQAMLSAGVQMV